MPLTELKCKSAKPLIKPYRISDSGGMYLEVMPNGSKYWRLKYRLLGREKRLAIGIYPETSLAEARTARDNAKKLIKAGEDPCFAKKEKRRERILRAEHTFEALAREWHSNRQEKWAERYKDRLLKCLEIDIFPHVGNRPINEKAPIELLETIKRIEKRGANETARRALQICGQVFKYAIATARAERNPTADLSGALTSYKKTHYAALDKKELPDFLDKLEKNDARLYQQTRNAVRMLMLTFVRTSELIMAKWEEFDLDKAIWIIPPERMKMRKAHIVPLSKQTLAILKEQKEISGKWEWVFPNQVRPIKPMSNNTILFAIGRLGYKGKMTGHGFRALAMTTIKEELGYRHEVVDRQLAHAHRNDVDAAYDRAQFLTERKKMMQEWADYLGTLENTRIVIQGNFKNMKV
jgi:integrase